MMTPTFEIVLNQARSLTPDERSKLVEMLTNQQETGPNVDTRRLNKIKSFRGKYRKILPSSAEFIAQKHDEVLIEER